MWPILGVLQIGIRAKVIENQHPRDNLADSDSMEDDTDADSINYPDEPEDDEDDDDTDDEDEEPTEDEKEEEHPAPADIFCGYKVLSDLSHPCQHPWRHAFLSMLSHLYRPPSLPMIRQAPLGHREAMIHMRDDIPEEDMLPQRRFVLAAPPPGCDVAESSAAVAARAPKGQYDFVDTVEARQGLIRSPGHDARTIARVANRAEDVGYVRALQTSEHMMMTSIEEVNLRVSYQAQVRRQKSKDFYTQLHDARTDRRDIRLEIDVVRGQRTTYETELHERQRAEDDAVRQMMRTHVLEARAQIDTNHAVTKTRAKNAMIRIHSSYDCWQIQRNFNLDDRSQSLGGEIRRPVQLARVCSYPDFMKCQPLNFKGTEGVVGMSQWIKKME
ncbi:hypothetical protein Tco_0538389 [Tanacetum coccineum]